MKTPLRYPGGKQRAAKRIVSHIPEGTTTLYSPFFGGGSVEFEWLEQNPDGKVEGRDSFEPLVNFWKHVKRGHAREMAERIRRDYLPLDKNSFYLLQDQFRSDVGTSFDRACWFYIINRSSFSGATLSGGMGNGDRFTQSSIDRLRDLEVPKGMRIRSGGFFDSLRRRTERFTPDTCIYLDPPYFHARKLYGNRGDTHFGPEDHKRLRRLLGKLNDQGVKWIMSYDNCPEIHGLYSDFRREPTEWKYGMSNDKTGRELLIFSDEVKVQ
jgi:DNA adenine methylase